MTLNALQRFGFALQGTLPQAEDADLRQEETYRLQQNRASMTQLMQDPSFLALPPQAQLAKIAGITGDPTKMEDFNIQTNDPLRKSEILKNQAELDNIHLEQQRMKAMGSHYDDLSSQLTGAPALANFNAPVPSGFAGGTNAIPPVVTSAANPLSGPFMPGAVTPSGPPAPGQMGSPPTSALSSFAPSVAPAAPLTSAANSALASYSAQPPAAPVMAAPAAAAAPPATAILAPGHEGEAIEMQKAATRSALQAAQMSRGKDGTDGRFQAELSKLATMKQQIAESVITPDNEGLIGQGEKFIETIPNPAVQTQARRYMNADDPPLVPTSRTPLVQKQAWEAAQAADKTLSSMSYPVKLSVKKAFADGPEKQNIKAIQTMINHIGLMDETDNGAKLPDHNLTLENMASNAIFPRVDPKAATALNDYNIYQKAVSSEGAKASRGVGAITEGELKENVHNLSADYARETRQAARVAIARLAAGKLQTLNEQWNENFPNQPKNFIAPAQAKILTKLGIDPSEFGFASAGASSSGAGGDIVSAAKAEMARRAGGK